MKPSWIDAMRMQVALTSAVVSIDTNMRADSPVGRNQRTHLIPGENV